MSKPIGPGSNPTSRPRGRASARTVCWLAALATSLSGLSGCAATAQSPPTRSYPTAITASPTDSVAEVQLLLTDGSYHATWISRSVAEQLNQRLADAEAAGKLTATDPLECPTVALFCAFKVAVAANQPVVFVQPTKVSVVRDSKTLGYADPDGSSYALVHDAAAKGFDPYTRDLLPVPDPEIPVVDASVPPLVGSAATWELANAKQVNSESTTLELSVTRAECGSGQTGELLEPVVSMGPRAIVIRVDAAPIEGAHSCQGNDAVPVKVALTEPVGDRDLIDAACLLGPAIRTEPCGSGAVRRKG